MSPKKTSSKKAAPKKAGASDSTMKPASRKKASRAKASSGRAAAEATTKKPVTAPKPSEMEDDVLEFIQAIDDYKRAEGRPFPTWSEILDIVKELGYERRA